MSKTTENCPICGGKLENRRVKLDLWVGDSLIVIENVPAEVCMVCGEEAYTPGTSQWMRSSRPKPAPRGRLLPQGTRLFNHGKVPVSEKPKHITGMEVH